MPARPRFQSLDPVKQAKILDSAAEEFADLGFDNSSLNRIIANAGISKGAAYYYFDDKDDLFATTVDHMFEKLQQAIGNFSITSLTADNFWDVLESYAAKSMDHLQTHAWSRRFIKMFWNYVDSHGDSKAVHLVFSNMRKQTVTFIHHGQSIGMVRTDLPDDLFVELLFGVGIALDRWLLKAVDGMDADEIKKHSETFVDLYKTLLSPRENVPSKERS